MNVNPFNTLGVSSVMAYLLSFLVLSTVMVSTIYTTDILIEEKAHDAAAIQAEQLANLVADTLIDMHGTIETHPDMQYSDQISIPNQLAGKDYYIELSDTALYVNLSDGMVSSRSISYDFSDININQNKRIYPGKTYLDLTYTPPSERWKVDFGTGNSYEHSPVTGGYVNAYAMPPENPVMPGFKDTFYPTWDENEYQYRLPILINFTPPPEWESEPETDRLHHYINVPIVLTPEYFNYEAANVMFYDDSDNPIRNVYSGKNFRADFKFWWEGGTKDPGGGLFPVLPSTFIRVGTGYSIEYWNPNGSSLIYLRVPLVLPASSSANYGNTLITMYYGHDDVSSVQDLKAEYSKRSIGDIAIGTGAFVIYGSNPLYDDFNDADLTDDIGWNTNHVTLPKGNNPPSCITLEKDEYIITADSPFFETFNTGAVFVGGVTIPTLNEVYNYIIDAKMKVLQGNGSIILRSKAVDMEDESCVFSLNYHYLYDSPGFWLHYHNVSLPGGHESMGNVPSPNVTDWVRIRSFQFNRTDSGEWFNFHCIVHDNDTFAPFPNVISNTSENTFDLNEARFGLGAGLIPGSEDAEVYVDWIRVMKTTGLYQPTVSIGSIEYRDFKWAGTPPAVTGESRKKQRANPFEPDPLTRDFVTGNANQRFELGTFPAGSYRLVVFKGDLEGDAGEYRLKINSGAGPITTTTIPSTSADSIVNVSILFTLDSETSVFLDFLDDNWVINGLHIEKDYYGIRLE